jgi:hypothetical protein
MNRLELAEQASTLEAYIQHGTVTNPDWGLCDNVLLYTFPTRVVFESWGYFYIQDSYVFPIEDTPSEYSFNERKHDRRTTYGKLRLSLAKHCLQWTLKELREVV